MLPRRGSLQGKRYKQTENKGIKIYFMQVEMARKRGQKNSSYKIDFKTKAVRKAKKALCNDKGINIRRECTQYKGT